MLPDGKHDLRIHASDIVGNDAEKTFSFTVDNTPPEILVKSPINGTTVSHSLNIDIKVRMKIWLRLGLLPFYCLMANPWRT